MVDELDKQKREAKLEKDLKGKEAEIESDDRVTKETPDETSRIEKKALTEGEKVTKPVEEKSQTEGETSPAGRDERGTARTRRPYGGYMPVVGADSESISRWKPKTALGKAVISGKITDMDQIFKSGKKIMEPEIADKLVPNMKSEMILIGGRRGKGGGIKRIPVQITATMHRSGRRFKYNALAVVGDEAGLIGVGKGSSKETRAAVDKAINRAKMNIIRIKKGCGSWECGCGGDHSIPYKAEGKSGSVRVVLMPAPKGMGLVADDESKKLLKLAGIKDVWVKTYGNTSMRINLVAALFGALKGLYAYDR